MIAVTDFDQTQKQFELDVFGKRGLTLVRASGTRVWDSTGREYIDCIAGQGSANLGHGHPKIVQAIKDQAEIMITCPGAFANDVRAQWMEELVRAAPPGLKRVFLCNSGTEAVEAALKFARISTGRHKIIAARGGFHGRTFGSLSATFNPKYRKGCGPLLPGFQHITFNDVEALQSAVDDDTAAVILEIVQGEGGVHIAHRDFIRTARRLCDEHQTLLIIDEVQTGFGRTGTLFASDQVPVEPDIMCLAKSIAGGLPMGAVLTRETVKVPIGGHGSTFGGNPLVCAAARATLKTLQSEKLAQHANDMGERFAQHFSNIAIPNIRQIRRLGLMIGIELRVSVRPIIKTLMDQNLLALAAGGTVLRLLPPLIIEKEEIDQIAKILINVLGQEP